jgi:integrase
MTTRRGRGEGSVYYDDDRDRWVGVLDVTEPGTAKRTRRKVSAKTKTELRNKLDTLRREIADAGHAGPAAGTVASVVADWTSHLPSRIKDPTSVAIVRRHASRIIAELGKIPVKRLQARDVERLLATMAAEGLSTSTIRGCRSVLARAIDRGMRDRLVLVNVARLAEIPEGTVRKSRSMTTAEARKLLASDLDTWWRAYFTLALYCGLRPGELTGLRWEDVDLASGLIRVRRSLKRNTAGLAPGELKTESSKRTLSMPEAVRSALTALRREQKEDRMRLGPHYQDKHNLVFRDDAGRPMSRQRLNIRFKDVLATAGLGTGWQPRETRHSFVSIASDNGVSIEDIADAAGHVNSNVTRAVYRHQISDTVTRAPAALDQALAAGGRAGMIWLPDRLPDPCNSAMTRHDGMTTTCASRMSSQTTPMTSPPGGSGPSTYGSIRSPTSRRCLMPTRRPRSRCVTCCAGPVRATRCLARKPAGPASDRGAGSSTRSTGRRTTCAASRSGPR